MSLSTDGGRRGRTNGDRQARQGGTLVAALVLPLAAVAAPASAEQSPKCNGHTATIVGTDGRNHIVGTPGDDVIASLDGADEVDGRGGDDHVCGGAGGDVVRGGPGADSLDGGDDVDVVLGDGGRDVLATGGARDYRYGRDALGGGRGDDVLHGDSGLNLLFGGPGDDVLRGFGAFYEECDCDNGFDEILSGGRGDDELTGGELEGDLVNNQVFVPGPGDDVVDSGREEEAPGSEDCGLLDNEACPDYSFHDKQDHLYYGAATGPVDVDLAAGIAIGEGNDTLVGIDSVEGTRYDDVISGDDTANLIFGGEGFGYDEIFGGGSNDRLLGGYGSDLLDGGDGAADYALGGSGEDRCVAVEHAEECEEVG